MNAQFLVITWLLLYAPQLSAPKSFMVVELKDVQGKPIGTATFSETASAVRIVLNVRTLAPGEHALHIHQVPKCEGPGFTSAGPHFNPYMKKHGLRSPQGPHAGDMNNFTVAANRAATTTVTNPLVSMGSGLNSIFANGGTALVIHAKPDDMMTDPDGNAGDRIACGTISKTAARGN